MDQALDQDLINRIVEAALLAANQPLSLAQLHALFPEDQPAPQDSVEQALEHLSRACEGRGVELVEVASGFRYQVRNEVHPWVARLWTERQTRYTRATLETLALIAYRQPITRGEIEQVRGVAVSSNIIKALEEREWIRVVGHRDVPGKPALYGTTKAFLDYFGLKRLDELPPLSELKDLGELEPQLPLAEGAVPAGVAPPAQDSRAAADTETGAAADGAEPSGAAARPEGGASAASAADAEAGAPADQPDTDMEIHPEPAPAAESAGDEPAADDDAVAAGMQAGTTSSLPAADTDADTETESEAEPETAGRSNTHE